MVKVALSWETGVALLLGVGTWRGVFPSWTVAKRRVLCAIDWKGFAADFACPKTLRLNRLCSIVAIF